MSISEQATPEQMKILFNINKLEKMIRVGRKDLRRMKRPLEKAQRNFNRLIDNVNGKNQMLKLFTEQRDSLLKQLHLIQEVQDK